MSDKAVTTSVQNQAISHLFGGGYEPHVPTSTAVTEPEECKIMRGLVFLSGKKSQSRHVFKILLEAYEIPEENIIVVQEATVSKVEEALRDITYDYSSLDWLHILVVAPQSEERVDGIRSISLQNKNLSWKHLSSLIPQGLCGRLQHLDELNDGRDIQYLAYSLTELHSRFAPCREM